MSDVIMSSGPPLKKLKKAVSTPKHGPQRYRKEYSEKFPVLVKSKLGDCYVRCTVCDIDKNISHGGLSDCREHLESGKHVSKARDQREHCGGIDVLFKKAEASAAKKCDVTRAELLFTNFLVEHNIPLAVADHASLLFVKMFPDSKLCKEYACKRTKTSEIVKLQGKNTSMKIAKWLEKQTYALSTDGSNDVNGANPLYPLVVRSFDDELGRVKCELLSMPGNTVASTGENIFKLVDDELKGFNLSWGNCLAFGSDNAAVMSGKNAGVISFVKKVHEQIYFQGCPCHLIHLAAEKAAAKLKFSAEDLLIDIYYYLDKSSRRGQTLSKFQELYSGNTHKILKHVSTRWLSLGNCVKRLLEQWDALTEHFNAEVKPVAKKGKAKSKGLEVLNPKSSSSDKDKGPGASKSLNSSDSDKAKGPGASKSLKSSDIGLPWASKSSDSDKSKGPGALKPSKSSDSDKAKGHGTQSKTVKSRPERVADLLNSKRAKLYCLFLNNIIPVFDQHNIALQKEEPCIHLLHGELLNLLTDLYIRFVKADYIASKSASLLEVEYSHRINQKERDALVLGGSVRAYISEVKAALPRKEVNSLLDEFYACVRDFFSAACDYILKKFPLQDALLKHAEVIDIRKRTSVTFASLEYMLSRFPCIMQISKGKLGASANMDRLEIEFLKYQIDGYLPTDLERQRIDVAWHQISNIKDPTTGLPEYELLALVMKALLVIPHSNAESERIFSMVRKNRTSFRPNLSNETLSALLVDKKCTIPQCHVMKDIIQMTSAWRQKELPF